LAIVSGHLMLKCGLGEAKTPVRRFFALLPDFVLYSFRSEADDRALTATPLPGHVVVTGAELKGDAAVPERDRLKIIRMSTQHSTYRKVYYFAGAAVDEVQR
jgi:hypothetical protein